MIEIKNLSKLYKHHKALQSVNLEISNGIYGLLGPNGAGKSTLMRIMATLMKPTAGDIFIDSYSINSDPEKVRSVIGYLPQHFHVYPQLTPVEILDFVGVMKGIHNKAERRDQIDYWLNEVNLKKKAKEKLKTLSHGMKQRVGIAQAFMGSPKLVILDEPTVGLDPEERLRFRNMISKEGLTKSILLSTHVVTDIESSCYDIAVLQNGKLLLDSTIEDLKEKACNKVWEGMVASTFLESFSDGTLLSTEYKGSHMNVRILADEKPFYGASLVEPTLEDGYLALLGGTN
ncbi:ATP-binding cassette domain-containing protein [Sutcliffiella rhizosphaerae]|uniref:Vitamin B12 import ATP-binding protein BtuD n=1 Tax=Sutcliffiella rhizosphaerae TaxID=2880967 RepID=A0ABM8YM19_9BACI|nr:ATP-binding cassette domain-containing protein [Sutcliffiella rhizosphaerae]CAG9621007.1 Vitamin B12 import ATP-binding protein BtuD [Sutcliffiella rhizosphaerae]